MRKPKLPPGSPDDTEHAFYEALQQADIEALMALWADDDDIVCVHPGGARTVGAAAIRASFEAIFANGGIPVQPQQVRRLHWSGGALHHLVERIAVPAAPAQAPAVAWLVASNVYVKQAQGWRLAAHHASPGTAQQPPPSGPEAPTTLH